MSRELFFHVLSPLPAAAVQRSHQAAEKSLLEQLRGASEDKTDHDRMDRLAHHLSEMLQGPDASAMARQLAEFLHPHPEQLLPEARFLIQSYLTVFRIDRPLRVATLFTLYGTQIRMRRQGEHPYAEDNLRKKIAQLEDLYRINPLVDWELILVADGDDRRPADLWRSVSSYDMARNILIMEYPEYFIRGKIKLFQLSQEDKEMLGSVRGGALAFGMRQALKDGAHLVLHVGGDLSAHAGQEGLLLQPLLENPNSVAIGSRRLPGSVVRGRRVHRSLMSALFHAWEWAWLPLRDIHDTQCAFKGFSSALLDQILPVDAHNRFESLETSVYHFLFDSMLFSRARLRGARLVEIPFAWFDTLSTTVTLRHAVQMALELPREWRLLRRWHRQAVHPAALDRPLPDSLRGSTKWRDLREKDTPPLPKIQAAMDAYDLGTRSMDQLQVEPLPGLPNRPPLKITAPSGVFVLKKAGDTLEEVRFVISMICRLRQTGSGFIPELQARTGHNADETDSYWIRVEGAYYVLEHFVPGERVDRLQALPRHFQEMGRALAHIHDTLGRDIPEGQHAIPPVTDVFRWRASVLALVQDLQSQEESLLSPADRLFLSEAPRLQRHWRWLEAHLSPEAYRAQPYQVVHGDLSFPNALFDADGTLMAVLDWERARMNPRVEDFKNPLTVIDPDRGRTYDFQSLVELTAAYQAVAAQALSEAELRFIPEVLRATFVMEIASRFLTERDGLDSGAARGRLDTILQAFAAFDHDFPEEEQAVDRFIRAVQQRMNDMLRGGEIVRDTRHPMRPVAA